MPSSIKIEFNRFPEIAAKLPVETSAVVRKAAYDVEAYAKMVVPVDTGNLKNSIQTTVTDGGLEATTETHVEYCEYVEFGTYKMGARPYMTPAAERVSPQYESAMRQLLNRL